MANRSLPNRLFRMLIGGLVGFGICALAAASGLITWLKAMPVEDIVSTGLALLFVMMAAFAALVSTSQDAYKAIAENYRDGDPVNDETLRMMRLNALLLLLSGLLLLAPPVAARLGVGEPATILVAVGLGVVMAVTLWLSLWVTRRSDELTRALGVEASAVSFWVLSTGLFGWAALVKLGLAPEVSSWSLITIAMGISLVVQIGLSIRRGMFA